MAISIPAWKMDPTAGYFQDIQQKAAASQTPQQRALQQQLQQSPEYRTYLAALSHGQRLNSPEFASLSAKAASLGMDEDSQLGLDGTVVTKDWISAHPKLYMALTTGGALAGAAAVPVIAGALAGSAAPTAAGATASGTYGPMAGGYAGATTSAAAPASIAAGSAAGGAASAAPAWMNSALWRTGVGIGSNALGTYLDNRGRQQAADTLASAADKAGAYSQQQNQTALAFAQQMQGKTQASLQFPGYYQQGQTTPTFGQMMNGQPGAGPRMNVPTPQPRMLDTGNGSPSFAQMMNPSQEPMVTVRAPTGETRTVPASQATRYLAAGAVRVN